MTAGSSTTSGQRERRVAQREALLALGHLSAQRAPETDRTRLLHVDALSQIEAVRGTAPDTHLTGRVISVADVGSLRFAWIRLLACEGEEQAVFVRGDSPTAAGDAMKLTSPGDIVHVAGAAAKTRKGAPVCVIRSWNVLAKAILPPPDRAALAEWLTQNRVAHLSADSVALKRATLKGAVTRALREELWARGFDEVETRVLSARASGAASRAFETSSWADGCKLHARVALEHELKSLLAAGCGKIFEIGPCFRNEGRDATHSPEFTMLEAYWPLATMQQGTQLVLELCEAAVQAAGDVHGSRRASRLSTARSADMRELLREADAGAPLCAGPEPDDREAEELPLYAMEALQVDVRPSYGQALEALFEAMALPRLSGFTVVTGLPADTSPLARRRSALLAQRAELYHGSVEVANFCEEETDPVAVRAALSRREELSQADAALCAELELGMPPCFGLGIGVDRIAMIASAARSLAEVQPLPGVR